MNPVCHHSDADTQVCCATPPDVWSKRLRIPSISRAFLQMAARVVRGYTIIQPRISATLPSATATWFSRIFADSRGIDPYTTRSRMFTKT
jgi:hypothetical protein